MRYSQRYRLDAKTEFHLYERKIKTVNSEENCKELHLGGKLPLEFSEKVLLPYILCQKGQAHLLPD